MTPPEMVRLLIIGVKKQEIRKMISIQEETFESKFEKPWKFFLEIFGLPVIYFYFDFWKIFWDNYYLT